MSGQRIGDYLLEARLGAGGMGAVYRVLHVPTGARRALKALSGTVDEEAARRFVREGEALAAVGEHPHVVRIHEAGTASGHPYLVMGLCAGGDLKARLKQGPLPPAEAARIALEVARGVAHVHAAGVIHRDLKPENVMFDDAGRALVTDFGLARVAGAEALTRTGTTMGTPAYMAPEQADGKAVDARADVWGLGAILYAMLVGRPPYEGATAMNILAKLLREDPTWPAELRPGTPPALDAIVRRAMARRPMDRYPSADAMVADLERAAAGEQVAPPRRARRGLIALAALVVVALAAGVGLRATWPETPPPPTPPPPPPVTTAPPPTPSAPAKLRSADPRRLLTHVRTFRAASGRPASVVWLDDQRLVVTHDGGFQLFDLDRQEAPRNDLPNIRDVAATASRVYAGKPGGVFAFGAGTLTEEAAAPAEASSAMALALAPAARLLAVRLFERERGDPPEDVLLLSTDDLRLIDRLDAAAPDTQGDVALTPDGGRLVVVDSDGVRLWAREGRGWARRWTHGGDGGKNVVALWPGGAPSQVLVGTKEGGLLRFTLDGDSLPGLQAPTLGGGLARAHATEVLGVASFDRGAFTLGGEPDDARRGDLRAWSLPDGRELPIELRPGEPWAVATSPSGTRLAVARDGERTEIDIYLLAVPAPPSRVTRVTKVVVPEGASTVAFEDDGRSVLVASRDGVERVRLDAPGREVVAPAAWKAAPRLVRDGARLWIGAEALLWRDAAARGDWSLAHGVGRVVDLAAPVGRAGPLGVVEETGSEETGIEHHARLHDRGDGHPLEALGRHDSLTRLAISPDGRWAAVSYAQNPAVIELWDVTDAASPKRSAELRRLAGKVKALAFSAGGQEVFAATDAKQVARLSIADPEGSLTIFDRSPDVTAESHVTSHGGSVWALAVDPRGWSLWSGGADLGDVRHWDLATGRPGLELVADVGANTAALAVAPAGDRVAAIFRGDRPDGRPREGDPDRLYVWSVE